MAPEATLPCRTTAGLCADRVVSYTKLIDDGDIAWALQRYTDLSIAEEDLGAGEERKAPDSHVPVVA